MTRETILAEVNAERQRQDNLWGGAAHDDSHSLEQWIVILSCHVGMASWDGSPSDACHRTEQTRKYDPVRYRREIMRVAAVAVAALEAFDRRCAAGNGQAHPCDEPPGADGDVRGTAGPGELWAGASAGMRPALPPEEFWQQVADRAGEPILVLDRCDPADRVSRQAEPCGLHAVDESQASPWQKKNHVMRVEPSANGVTHG